MSQPQLVAQRDLTISLSICDFSELWLRYLLAFMVSILRTSVVVCILCWTRCISMQCSKRALQKMMLSCQMTVYFLGTWRSFLDSPCSHILHVTNYILNKDLLLFIWDTCYFFFCSRCYTKQCSWSIPSLFQQDSVKATLTDRKD